MSAEAMSWAKRQELPALQKLVLVMIADAASSEGVAVLVGGDLVRDVGAARSTVMKHVGELERAGLLQRRPDYREDGGYRATVYRLPLVRETDTPVREADPPCPAQSGQPARTRDQATTTSLPSRTARKANRTLVFSLDDDPDEEVAEDGQTFLSQRRKVGTQIVTAGEMRLAVICMTEFNRVAGTDQSLGPNLVAIVGRIREHPSWDAAKFIRLIESAFRLRWWEKNGRRRPGSATPKVIFGSTDCFVNVANDAADEAAGRTEEIEQRRGKYDRSVVRDV